MHCRICGLLIIQVYSDIFIIFVFSLPAHKPVKPARGMPKPAPPKWKPPSISVPHVTPPPPPSWEASPRANVQAAPSFPSNAPAFQSNVEYSSTPAWRDSLKKTATKPWDTDIDYATESLSASNPPRSVSHDPVVPTTPEQDHAPALTNNTQPPENDEGARVLHLQYNSPMGLYSQENVRETLHGQTQAKAPMA